MHPYHLMQKSGVAIHYFTYAMLSQIHGGNNNFTKSSIGEIVDACCDIYHVKKSYVMSRNRRREFVRPKQIAMFLIKHSNPETTLKTIGEHFDGYDHTTVRYSINSIQGLLSHDIETQKMVKLILASLKLPELDFKTFEKTIKQLDPVILSDNSNYWEQGHTNI